MKCGTTELPHFYGFLEYYSPWLMMSHSPDTIYPDTLHINGIRAYGYTGALPEEQVLGQWFSANITLWVNLEKAAESDRLDDTRDYSAIVTDTLDLIRTSRFALIEKLAVAIATLCLQYDDVSQVRVQLTKEVPPIPDFAGHIIVDITRQKTK